MRLSFLVSIILFIISGCTTQNACPVRSEKLLDNNCVNSELLLAKFDGGVRG